MNATIRCCVSKSLKHISTPNCSAACLKNYSRLAIPIITSHSPTLAAVAPLRAIVHLKEQDGKAHAYSLANLPVTTEELDDIECYLNATRSELLFSHGVIFIEGDAEETLMPAFANALG